MKSLKKKNKADLAKLAKRVVTHTKTLSPDQKLNWWMDRVSEAVNKGEDISILEKVLCKPNIPGTFCVYKKKDEPNQEDDLLQSFSSLSEAVEFVKTQEKGPTYYIDCDTSH